MTETLEIARKNMVTNQLRPNRIKEAKILNLFESVPKENFLYDNLEKNCYLDKDLDLTSKRGYLKNLHLAQLIKYSEIVKEDKVLHIGGLTGYFSFLISYLCKELNVIEVDEDLLRILQNNITNSGRTNINIYKNNLLEGCEKKSPFNLIIIDGPMFQLPENIKKQMSSNGGRLVYIKKINDNLSKAYRIIKNDLSFSTVYLFDVMTKYQIQEQEKVFNF